MEAQFYFYQQVSKSPYKTTQKKIEEGPNGFHLLKGVIFSFFLQSKNTARRFFSHLMNHKAKSSLTPESPKPKCLYLFHVHPIMVFRTRLIVVFTSPRTCQVEMSRISFKYFIMFVLSVLEGGILK